MPDVAAGHVGSGLRGVLVPGEQVSDLIVGRASAKGAFAAQATLAIARSGTTPSDSPLREALGEFIRAAGLVRRIGVNLNQAVAKLNATGQRSGDLLPYAAESIRRAQLLDQAAEELRKRIRQ